MGKGEVGRRGEYLHARLAHRFSGVIRTADPEAHPCDHEADEQAS